MILHFVGGRKSPVIILKETKSYLYIQCIGGYRTKYRVNRQTGEVQDNVYHKPIKGLYLTEN